MTSKAERELGRPQLDIRRSAAYPNDGALWEVLVVSVPRDCLYGDGIHLNNSVRRTTRTVSVSSADSDRQLATVAPATLRPYTTLTLCCQRVLPPDRLSCSPDRVPVRCSALHPVALQCSRSPLPRALKECDELDDCAFPLLRKSSARRRRNSIRRCRVESLVGSMPRKGE